MRARLLVVALMTSAGCSAANVPPPHDEDASADAGSATQDAAPAEDAQADAGVEPPVVETQEPETITPAAWRTAIVDSANDAVFSALERDTFTFPLADSAYGATWRDTAVAMGGALPSPRPGQLVYAAANVDVPDSQRVFARADFVLSVHANGARQPGDVYGYGRARVPLETHAGANLIVVRGYGGRGTPSADLFSTPDEIVFNTLDVTFPDLVEGSTDAQWLGVHVLNLTDRAALDLRARVETSTAFQASEERIPGLPAGAVTQVAFKLTPQRPWMRDGKKVRASIVLSSRSLERAYRTRMYLNIVPRGATHRRSFRSGTDGSAQYYGVVPPSAFDATKQYGLVLTLHGAGVEGIGQAAAYSPKDWTYVVAATNRRQFGFDWEEWGTLDALEVLDDAARAFHTDPRRQFLTGHSMGGHGTWHVGVLFPHHFAVVAPSAGWISFESYTGRRRSQGPFGRSEAASNTLDYKENLARRSVYIIHGSADDNVPVNEARTMVFQLRGVVRDLTYHEEPGAGHWWDGDRSPGADCVDWPPLFERMSQRTRDPSELVFAFRSPSPSVSPVHSYLTILSAQDQLQDVAASSTVSAGTLTLTTTNVRSMRIDGAALRARQITRMSVDGRDTAVPDGPLVVGPESGKRPGAYGPLNDVFRRPFCFVYAEDDDAARRYAAFLTSSWALIGNGHACALPLSAVTDQTRRERNLVFIGLPPQQLGVDGVTWDEQAIELAGNQYQEAAMVLVYPAGERLDAAFTATAGSEYLWPRLQPFTSGFAVPDYLVWTPRGGVAAGFFTSDWSLP